MEGLFFVIDQVWLVHNISMGYFILSIAMGWIIYFIYTKKSKSTIVSEKPSKLSYIPVEPNDAFFIEKTLLEIRKYLSKKYLPEHSWAHTSKDITEYIMNPILIELIKDLEYKEYTGIHLNNQESKDINTQLIHLLQ